MSRVIVDRMRITEGFITILDNGDYILIEETSAGPRETHYERGSGPYALQLLVDRALRTEASIRGSERARALDERLQSLHEANRALRSRLREHTRGTGSGEGAPVAPGGAGRGAALVPRAPPPQDGPAIPVSAPLTVRLGPVPPNTFNCTFSPLYEIFGSSLHVRARAISPPPEGDWRVGLYECPARWPRVHGVPDYCNSAFGGEEQEGGRNTRAIELEYDPVAWNTRRVFFRIRNGSVSPIPDVELTLTPAITNPVTQLLHDVLMVIGLLPGIGIVADGADLVLYLLEGDAGGATISAAALLPVFGDLATLARIGRRQVVRVPQTVVARMERETLQDALREAIERDRRGDTRARVDAPESRAREPRVDAQEGSRRGDSRGGVPRGSPDTPEGRRAAAREAGGAANEAADDAGEVAARGAHAASGARGMARYTTEGRVLLERAAVARGTSTRSMVATFSRVGDDIVRFVNRFHDVSGADHVIRDYLTQGHMRQGAQFVMRYAEANMTRTSSTASEMAFEQARARVRRTDLMAFGIRYEFKSVTEFRGYDARLRRQLRLDLADVLAQMPLSMDSLRWVFNGERIGGDRFARTFLIQAIQDVLTREFSSHPRMADLHAWAEANVEVWSR